jgi:hypothetical protein
MWSFVMGWRRLGRRHLFLYIAPTSVKIIKNEAFISCSWITNVQLGEGLEEIGVRAFAECTSLLDILIPPPICQGNFERGIQNLHTVDDF